MLLGNRTAGQHLRRAERELDDLVAARFEAGAVAEVQARKLAEVWRRAATTPYYGPLVDPVRPDLTALGVTPKAEVRRAPHRFLTPGASRALRYYETSGTSGGGPISAPRMVEDVVWNTVTLARAWAPVLPASSSSAILLPSDVAPIGDTVAAICEYLGVPHVRCYPFATGICDFDRLTGIFERFGPRCLFTAPGLALQLMRALKRREAFGSSAARIERLMLMGEVVTPSLRAMLAREWRADALDASYGSTETGTIAATCEDGSLHVLAHAFMAEVVLADGTPQPLVPGVRGDLVVTTLNAYARPLLRYETGDSVEVGDGCACGGPLQTITVLGRAAEALTVDGVALDVAAIERVVYGIGGLTGYLVEVRVDDSSLSLVLERDVGTDAAESDIASEALQAFHGLGVDLASVRVVHQLPPSSKSGAAQKNWKKTNVRMVAS